MTATDCAIRQRLADLFYQDRSIGLRGCSGIRYSFLIWYADRHVRFSDYGLPIGAVLFERKPSFSIAWIVGELRFLAGPAGGLFSIGFKLRMTDERSCNGGVL